MRRELVILNLNRIGTASTGYNSLLAYRRPSIFTYKMYANI